jgi:hypothetical protein
MPQSKAYHIADYKKNNVTKRNFLSAWSMEYDKVTFQFEQITALINYVNAEEELIIEGLLPAFETSRKEICRIIT